MNGISWGNVGEEEVVVTVGEGGRMVVWQPQHNAFQVHTLPQSPELTVVEVNPKDRSQALVAANKNIALVNLKSGYYRKFAPVNIDIDLNQSSCHSNG